MLPKPTFDDYVDKEEDVDIYPAQGVFGGTRNDDNRDSETQVLCFVRCVMLFLIRAAMRTLFQKGCRKVEINY